jgi:hypothetical protein
MPRFYFLFISNYHFRNCLKDLIKSLYYKSTVQPVQRVLIDCLLFSCELYFARKFYQILLAYPKSIFAER